MSILQMRNEMTCFLCIATVENLGIAQPQKAERKYPEKLYHLLRKFWGRSNREGVAGVFTVPFCPGTSLCII